MFNIIILNKLQGNSLELGGDPRAQRIQDFYPNFEGLDLGIIVIGPDTGLIIIDLDLGLIIIYPDLGLDLGPDIVAF